MRNCLKQRLFKLTLLTITALSGNSIASAHIPDSAKLLTVNTGTYELNNFLSDDLTIHGATLGGKGSIAGSLIVENNGIFSPGFNTGNKIGSISIGGDYTQDSDSTFVVEIGNNGTNDVVVVHNDAHLAGTLQITPLDGPITTKHSQLIMHVEGNVVGSFDQITTNDEALITDLLFINDNGATNILLNVDNHFVTHAVTHNQQNVGFLLANNTPENEQAATFRNEVLHIAQSGSPERLQQVYDQASGYQYGNILPVANLAVSQFIRRLYDPLRSIVTYYREPSNCWDPQYFDPYSNLPILLDNSCGSCNPVPPTLDFWMDIGGGRATFSGNSNSRRFHINNFEITGGLQTTFLSDWTFGGALSYARQSFSRNSDGHGGVNNGFLGLYTLYRPMGWYALGDLVLGYNQSKISRRIDTDENSYRSTARPKTYEAVLYLEAGFDWPWQRFLVQPFLGFETGSYSRNGAHEHGDEATNIDIFSSDTTTTSSRLGIHLTTLPHVLCNYSLSIDLAWQYRFNGPGSSVRGYSPSFSDEFSTKGITCDKNLFDAAVTLTTTMWDDWEVYGEVDLLGSSNLFAYDFIFGFKYRW